MTDREDMYHEVTCARDRLLDCASALRRVDSPAALTPAIARDLKVMVDYARQALQILANVADSLEHECVADTLPPEAPPPACRIVRESAASWDSLTDDEREAFARTIGR